MVADNDRGKDIAELQDIFSTGGGLPKSAAGAGGLVRGQAGDGVEGEQERRMHKRMMGPSDLKAGLGGKRDADEVAKIIYEASKGSVYFKDQERKDKDLEAKSNRLKRHLDEKRKEADGHEEDNVDRILEQLEEKRDLSRVIALIDADAFYAACHQREDPSLAGKPFGVGGGVLTTASYEARKYGCRSAMPLYLAQKLCPHLISVKLQPELYVKASREIMAIYEKYGSIAPASLDEAYVDLTQYCADHGVSPAEAITRLRTEVRETTGLTVSAGVTPNKALSKIAADINKPDGQFVIDFTKEGCMDFIKTQRLRKCFGIGRVTEVLLNAVGFVEVGDLFTNRKDLYLIRDHLGNKDTFKWLLSLYLGLGSNRVVRAKRGDRKTYGVEKTFHPTDNSDTLEGYIRAIAKALAKDIGRAEFSGRTITLKLKYANYQVITRAFTPGKGTWVGRYRDILEYGLRQFRKEQEDRRVAVAKGVTVKGGQAAVVKLRLLGLRISNLRDEREIKKENKLDGWFTKTTSPSKKKWIDTELSLLSDTDDSDLEHSDHDSEGEEDDIPEKRELARLKQEALLADPFAMEEKPRVKEEMGAAGGGESSGRWMCVDEDLIVNEGLPVAGPSKPKSTRRTSGSSSSSSSSSTSSTTLVAGSSSARESKRPSPSFANHEVFAAADLDLTNSSPPSKKKQKKVTRKGVKQEEGEEGEEEEQKPSRMTPKYLTCPVCDKKMQASEVAMEGHVLMCLKSFNQPAGKKKKASTSTSSSSMFGSCEKAVKGKGKKW